MLLLTVGVVSSPETFALIRKLSANQKALGNFQDTEVIKALLTLEGKPELLNALDKLACLELFSCAQVLFSSRSCCNDMCLGLTIPTPCSSELAAMVCLPLMSHCATDTSRDQE